MSGLGEHDPAFQNAGGQVTPNELDRYEYINTGVLSISATWVGTAAGGTSTQAKALVLINTLLDYPRNLLYGVVGTSDMGGTWSINGLDQFGQSVTESVGSGTVAQGTPAFAIAGTKIFAKVLSGTFTVATGALGAGSAQLGVAIGTSATAAFKLGLLTKINSTADIKMITWVKTDVPTTLNGGTIGSFVDVTNNAFSGSAIMAGTEAYKVLVKSTWNNLQKTNLASL